MCSIQIKNVEFSESTVLAEVGNKALQHSSHGLDPNTCNQA